MLQLPLPRLLLLLVLLLLLLLLLLLAAVVRRPFFPSLRVRRASAALPRTS